MSYRVCQSGVLVSSSAADSEATPPPRIAIRRTSDIGQAPPRSVGHRGERPPGDATVPGSVAHASILTRMSEAPFSPFVPAILTERLARTGRDVAGPDGWRTAGVVLVIDITGFTALTERLAEHGPDGADTLASILNESFGDVIERIHTRGGDVVSFAGDAILAVWPREADDLPGAVVAAASCALEGQRLLEGRPPVEGVHVRA